MSIADAATATLLRGTFTQGLDEIVNESLPAVRYLAGRLAWRVPPHVDVDDLIQVGVIGLLQSADRFDSQRGVKFQTYANRRIQGAMLDYLRSLDWRPRSARARSRLLEKAYCDAGQRLGSRPTEEDVAHQMGVGIPELEHWKQTSAPASSRKQWEEISSMEYLEGLADPSDSPESALEKLQMRSALIQAIDHLPKRERLVLSLHYYEELTMREISQLLGVRPARVSQLHSQATARLRKALERGNRSNKAAVMKAATSARDGASAALQEPATSLPRSAIQATLAPIARRRTLRRVPAFTTFCIARQAARTA
jgi:RNA polymerase sigma factor for flagellar operon FliA